MLLLAACTRPAPPPLDLPPLPPPPPPPSGELRDGVYSDFEFPFTLSAPASWIVTLGQRGGALRVRLEDPESELGFEVWTWRDGALGPRPREGCDWAFQDRGHYTLPAAVGATVVATCRPAREDGPRILGWYLANDAVIYALEASLPDGELGESLGVVDSLVNDFAWAIRP